MMVPLSVTMNCEIDPWTDLKRDAIVPGDVERIGLMPDGTASGRPAVILLVRLPDGTPVVAQTTWALLRSAVRALNASPVADLDRMEHPE